MHKLTIAVIDYKRPPMAFECRPERIQLSAAKAAIGPTFLEWAGYDAELLDDVAKLWLCLARWGEASGKENPAAIRGEASWAGGGRVIMVLDDLTLEPATLLESVMR